MLPLDATPTVSSAQAVIGNLLTFLQSETSDWRPTVAHPSLSLPTELQAAQQAFWCSSLSRDTVQAYQTRKSKWKKFCIRFQRSPEDLSPSNIIDYLTYLATIAKKGGPLCYTSIKAYSD